MTVVAREDARSAVESEMESLLREKASLMVERKRFEDERSADMAMKAAVSEMRHRHREMEDELLQKTDEVTALKKHLQRIQTAMSSEKTATTQLLDRCGLGDLREGEGMFGLDSASKVDGILALIRRNVELESSLQQLRSELGDAGESVAREQQRFAEVMLVLSDCEKVRFTAD